MQTSRSMRTGLFAALMITGLGSHGYAADADGDGTLNHADTFPCNPSYSGLAFAPAEGVHGTLIFEDQWPGPNDHDMNDVVLGYNYVYFLNSANKVVRVVAKFSPRALGGRFNMGMGLHLPIPKSSVSSVTGALGAGAATPLVISAADTELTVDVSSNLREAFGGAAGPINSRADRPRQTGQDYTIVIELSTPETLFAAGAPHDVFLFHTDARGHELHRPMFPGTSQMDATLFGSEQDDSSANWKFVDGSRIPSAIDLPANAEYPSEETNVLSLFPDMAAWATSGGVSNPNFYSSTVNATHAYRDNGGQSAPPPGPAHSPTIDMSCVAAPVTPTSNITYDASNISEIMNAALTVPVGVTVTIDYAGTLRLQSLDLRGTMQPRGCDTANCSTLDIEVVDYVDIAPSGRLNADGLGYLGSYQSPNTSRYGRTVGNRTIAASTYVGGTHCGWGGQYQGATSPSPYDSAKHPIYPGAGGTGHNRSSSTNRGGNGGGAIKMVVGGRLTIDGEVSADGAAGGSSSVAGAGGSIWLDAAELTSNVSGVRVGANGGNGKYAGGGGGCVAVYGTPVGGFTIDNTTVSAAGGRATFSTGNAYKGGAAPSSTAPTRSAKLSCSSTPQADTTPASVTSVWGPLVLSPR